MFNRAALCDNIEKIYVSARHWTTKTWSVVFLASVMDSYVCQTCGLQFASTKARNMHEVRVHAKSARCAVNVGKHVFYFHSTLL